MSLKEKIQDSLKSAIKSGDSLTVSVLRMLNASILNKEKEKRAILSKSGIKEEERLIEESRLTDEEVIEAISFEAKKRRESIEQFRKGGREDLVNQEEQELTILQPYLPEQLSEEVIEEIVREAITASGAKNIQDMGKVMKIVMPQVKGKADGNTVNSIVKKLFQIS